MQSLSSYLDLEISNLSERSAGLDKQTTRPTEPSQVRHKTNKNIVLPMLFVALRSHRLLR